MFINKEADCILNPLSLQHYWQMQQSFRCLISFMNLILVQANCVCLKKQEAPARLIKYELRLEII